MPTYYCLCVQGANVAQRGGVCLSLLSSKATKELRIRSTGLGVLDGWSRSLFFSACMASFAFLPTVSVCIPPRLLLASLRCDATATLLLHMLSWLPCCGVLSFISLAQATRLEAYKNHTIKVQSVIVNSLDLDVRTHTSISERESASAS